MLMAEIGVGIRAFGKIQDETTMTPRAVGGGRVRYG